MKRIFIFFLTLVLCLSLLCVSVFAESASFSFNLLEVTDGAYIYASSFDSSSVPIFLPDGEILSPTIYLSINSNLYELSLVDSQSLVWAYSDYLALQLESELSLVIISLYDFGESFSVSISNQPIVIESSSSPLGVISSVLLGVISWVGVFVSSLLGVNGALSPLLGIFAVGISVSILIFSIRFIRFVIWGE